MEYKPHTIPLRPSSEKYHIKALIETIQDLMSQWHALAKAQIYLCANSGCSVHVHPYLFLTLK